LIVVEWQFDIHSRCTTLETDTNGRQHYVECRCTNW